MSAWRLLDTGRRTAAENMALDEAVLRAVSRGEAPNTLRFMQFDPPAVLVGFHQSAQQEARLAYCRENGIDVNRRVTGGGAIFFDRSQIGWEVVCGKSFFDVGVADPAFFGRVCQPVVNALKELGIDAEFRPRNDIEVNGRKISGTGGTEEGDAFLFQGTLLVDFDVGTMFRALRVPVEKLKDHEIEDAKERVTCLKWELEEVPSGEKLKELLARSFEHEFGVKLESSDLTESEQARFDEQRARFGSDDWVYKVKFPESDQPIIHSAIKTRGGIIRTALVVNLRTRRIQSILFSGDFFVFPQRALYDLEAKMRDHKVDAEELERTVAAFFAGGDMEASGGGTPGIRMPGIGPADFTRGIDKAMGKLDMADMGIPLEMTNRIMTVNGTFREIMAKRPTHLLLPYCAKSPDCGYRKDRECPECGDCTTGDAYGMGREHEMWTTTIQSFEDLQETLVKLKSEGVQSYVGSCCEAFFLKHMDEFEDSGLPAVLVDIDSTTCYELGQEQEAYAGKFERVTELNVDLIRRVLEHAK